MIREKIPPKKVPTKQKMKMYGSEKWLFTPHGTNQWSNLVFWDKDTKSQRGLVESFYFLVIDIYHLKFFCKQMRFENFLSSFKNY